MDETDKTEPKVRRVRRTKAEMEMARAAEGVKVEAMEDVVIEPLEFDEANDLAMRIWEGQSPDLPLIDRVGRIKNALLARGLDVAGLVLPDPGYKKYL